MKLDKKFEIKQTNTITDVNKPVTTEKMCEKWAGIRQQYLEEMACAYLKKTQIDPRNVVLVEEHNEKGSIRWFFAEKSQTKLGDKLF